MTEHDPEGMRLDLFLKITRLVKRRSLAQRYCEDGSIEVDGRVAKPGRKVVPGSRIRLRLPAALIEVEVVDLPAGNVVRQDARDYYELLESTEIETDEET